MHEAARAFCISVRRGVATLGCLDLPFSCRFIFTQVTGPVQGNDDLWANHVSAPRGHRGAVACTLRISPDCRNDSHAQAALYTAWLVSFGPRHMTAADCREFLYDPSAMSVMPSATAGTLAARFLLNVEP